MLEAQISDLQSQLNSIKEKQSTENAINGSGTYENQTQKIDDGDSSPDDF